MTPAEARAIVRDKGLSASEATLCESRSLLRAIDVMVNENLSDHPADEGEPITGAFWESLGWHCAAEYLDESYIWHGSQWLVWRTAGEAVWTLTFLGFDALQLTTRSQVYQLMRLIKGACP